FESLVYGSLARGDVSQGSDIDIIIPGVARSFMVELALDEHGITGRKLVQATPGGLEDMPHNRVAGVDKRLMLILKDREQI
ncbi:MAG: nucleotidyltransferase domain-containing protein, partial [Pirellulales bacterium]|nr:nucleotidyltransferase domain-containing protein [Pirellulales bacterium]